MNQITKKYYNFLISKIKFFVLFYYLLGSFATLAEFKITKNINYRASDTTLLVKKYCNLDIYSPVSKVELPTVVFFHGGGLTAGEKSFPEPYIVNNDFIIVAPDYRLSPSVKCPTYIEDAAEAVSWVFENIKNYGGSSSKIFLAGYSAGAYLANMIFFDKSYLSKYGIDPDSLAGLFSFSSQMTTHFTIMAERGISTYSENTLVDKYAPLYFSRNVKPYTMLLTGDRSLDMAGRYVQNTKMYESLKLKGSEKVEYIELINKNHATLLDSAILLSKQKIKEILTVQNLKFVDSKRTNFIDKNEVSSFVENLNFKKLIFYNLNGEVFSEIDAQKMFDMSRFKTGIYILKIISEEKVCSYKFFIK